MVGQAVHYECAQGFRALQRGPATSVCEMTCGKTRWTRPQIKCVKERQDGQLPGTEAPSPTHTLLLPSARPMRNSRPTRRAARTGLSIFSGLCFSLILEKKTR